MTKLRVEVHNVASEDVRKEGPCRAVGTGVGGSESEVVTRLMDAGSAGEECIAVNAASVDLKALKASRRVLIGEKLTKGLGTIAPQLFNMEPQAKRERLLNLKLELYQLDHF